MARLFSLPLLLLTAAASFADEPPVIPRPDAFKTLVNPMCSHCRDEAKRRVGELKADDRVLCWTRGYSDGGAIPIRFFLSPYRVISDTYGVFVYDPDAGFARGFAPSLDFRFHGWRNGVMVMKHKDGTLYSCLTGIAFDGPNKGQRLAPVPTLVSDWGFWLTRYPGAVAYQMFDKYQPVELPATVNADARKSRPAKRDDRLPDDGAVLGVAHGKHARAYPLDALAKAGLVRDEVGGTPWVVLWHGPTRTAAAYLPVASPPKKEAGAPRPVTLALDPKGGAAAYIDQETKSRWDVAGRAVEGDLKGWTLTWLDGTQVKWFAWAAEYPQTTIFAPAKSADAKKVNEAVKEIAGTAEVLRAVPKKFALLKSVDLAKHAVMLLAEGEKEAKTWPLTADAEVKVMGWWGRLDELPKDGRVWVWFKVNRAKTPVAVFMIADEPSEQDMHGPGLLVEECNKEDPAKITIKPAKGPARVLETDRLTLPAQGSRCLIQTAGGRITRVIEAGRFEGVREEQQRKLAQRWEAEGLPGTVTITHVSGELEYLLDHEGMRWGRSLVPGAAVSLQAEPPIKAVVKSVRPWRERTLLRLVVGGVDSADLKIGDRVRLKMPAPPPAVRSAELPPDVDRVRGKAERIEWFLASIYCTCPVGGDGCTGDFYTLASCNPNGCGMPNRMRKVLAEKIDQGLSDRQIFAHLLKTHGPKLVRPHLLP